MIIRLVSEEKQRRNAMRGRVNRAVRSGQLPPPRECVLVEGGMNFYAAFRQVMRELEVPV